MRRFPIILEIESYLNFMSAGKTASNDGSTSMTSRRFRMQADTSAALPQREDEEYALYYGDNWQELSSGYGVMDAKRYRSVWFELMKIEHVNLDAHATKL
ncbi:hypothetical protein TRIUR3_27584 [Triticum urartu]|uniref:Uncharacterized protein n=1 Tax=Triticum urartu TaxID=4572 RepID=M7ZRN2_TRIUA|nr:hypothetical protein TRIUR3_27584 [Triticum urartu]